MAPPARAGDRKVVIVILGAVIRVERSHRRRLGFEICEGKGANPPKRLESGKTNLQTLQRQGQLLVWRHSCHPGKAWRPQSGHRNFRGGAGDPRRAPAPAPHGLLDKRLKASVTKNRPQNNTAGRPIRISPRIPRVSDLTAPVEQMGLAIVASLVTPRQSHVTARWSL